MFQLLWWKCPPDCWPNLGNGKSSWKMLQISCQKNWDDVPQAAVIVEGKPGSFTWWFSAQRLGKNWPNWLAQPGGSTKTSAHHHTEVRFWDVYEDVHFLYVVGITWRWMGLDSVVFFRCWNPHLRKNMAGPTYPRHPNTSWGERCFFRWVWGVQISSQKVLGCLGLRPSN